MANILTFIAFYHCLLRTNNNAPFSAPESPQLKACSEIISVFSATYRGHKTHVDNNKQILTHSENVSYKLSPIYNIHLCLIPITICLTKIKKINTGRPAIAIIYLSNTYTTYPHS